MFFIHVSLEIARFGIFGSMRGVFFHLWRIPSQSPKTSEEDLRAWGQWPPVMLACSGFFGALL